MAIGRRDANRDSDSERACQYPYAPTVLRYARFRTEARA
nr:MAG TPA: hypothetical protein [Caudoviricetes sp.]